MATFETLIAQKREATKTEAVDQQKARAAYEKLVMDSLEGRELDPDEVLATIAAAGFTFSQFERHVADEQYRVDLEKTVAGEVELKRQSQALMAEREQIGKDFEQFNREIQQRMKDSHFNCHQNRNQGIAMQLAKDRLSKYRGVARGFSE